MSSYWSMALPNAGTTLIAALHCPTARSSPTASDHTAPCNGCNHNPLSRPTRSCWATGRTALYRFCGLSSLARRNALNSTSIFLGRFWFLSRLHHSAKTGSALYGGRTDAPAIGRYDNWTLREPCRELVETSKRRTISITSGRRIRIGSDPVKCRKAIKRIGLFLRTVFTT